MASTFHLTKTDYQNEDNRIEQGATFQLLTIQYPADISTWNFRGQIRKNYADNSEEILAELEFNINYSPGEEKTIIIPIISASVTRTIKSPKSTRSSIRDKAIPGQNVWVYDIEAESPTGEVIRLLEGWVEVA